MRSAMTNRIKCPGSGLNTQCRIDELKDNLIQWLSSKEMTELLSLFNGEDIIYKGDLLQYIKELNRFVKRWDFRKKQSDGGERWNIYDDSKVTENEKIIWDCAKGLGMIDVSTTKINPDYILPLGGARMTNLLRPKMAKELLDFYQWDSKLIVALSGNRLINDIERETTDRYAPKAVTEYDAINAGLEHTFNIKKYEENKEINKNINLQSTVRKYTENYRQCEIYSIAAPSTDPGRRANSLDTFTYFINKFSIKEKTQILLVTSAIYAPYQLLKFIPLALEYDLEVDVVGTPPTSGIPQTASHYLQEIKSIVDAIYDMSNIFVAPNQKK